MGCVTLKWHCIFSFVCLETCMQFTSWRLGPSGMSHAVLPTKELLMFHRIIGPSPLWHWYFETLATVRCQHSITFKKAWIFSNFAVRTSDIANFMLLIWCIFLHSVYEPTNVLSKIHIKYNSWQVSNYYTCWYQRGILRESAVTKEYR